MTDSQVRNLATVKELVQANRHSEATQALLGSLAEVMISNLSSQEKLNHLLFMSRAVQAGGSAKYGYQKLLRKVRRVKAELAFLPDLPLGGMLDLGCGTHDPLALATYFHLNGYEPAYCCDLSRPRNEYYSALSMYEIMANIRAFPARYRFRNCRIIDIVERWKQFDVSQFELGSLMNGLGHGPAKVNYHIGDICDLDAPRESLGLVVSFAVFEHVSDLAGVNDWLYQRMVPGGVLFHFIDLADHRSFETGNNISPFTFLTEPVAPPGLNRVRAAGQLAAFEAAGFQVLKARRRRQPVPEEVRRRLLPPWSEMPEDEIATLKLTVVLRKPAQN